MHRELSVAWICQALLLGGQHQLDLGGRRDSASAPAQPEDAAFDGLEFGCGFGLNLILNAAAHPEGRFYGIDLNPSHVASATALAAELGLGNVRFAVADLRAFAAGKPERGPWAEWPGQFDLVQAHGVAAWVSAEVREALVAAAGSLLRPGGVFQCSYNTNPGWLARRSLVMLCQERALRAGGVVSASLVRATAEQLGEFLGSEAEPLPLGAAFPSLRSTLEGVLTAADRYLEGEFHVAHQPLDVGPFHRLCAAHGLTAIGSATLPELFPQMLDPVRRALVEQAEDPTLRQVLLDLAIDQSFRRDLFARGVCPPSPAERRQNLAALPVVLRAGSWPEDCSFDTPLGRMGVDPSFCGALRQGLQASSLSLGELAEHLAEPLEVLLPRLAVLVHSGLLSLGGWPGVAGDSRPASASLAAFHGRVLARASAGDHLGWLVSPLLLQPVPITPVEAFFLPLVDQGMAAEEVAQLVWMGISLAGGSFRDPQGCLLEDPAAVMAQLVAGWQTFQRDRLPEWRRLGLVSTANAA